MKKVLTSVLVLLTVFAMINCSNGSTSDDITISFDLNGGPGVKPDKVTIAKGGTLGAKYPEMSGNDAYTFLGWYDVEKKVTATTPLNNSVTLKAKWSAKEDGGLDLKPWGPDDNPTEPAAGYKNYYAGTDPEEWMYSTFAGMGNVGAIEANTDGTYTVSIKTNPGGISIISFNSLDYMFKHGYYLLADFPANTVHKPIAALVMGATGSKNDDGQDWQTIYDVNHEGAYKPTLDDVYLSGEIAFARDDLNTLLKSIFITIVWHNKEEDGYYDFILKKLLITTGEDLTPPLFEESYTPDPIPEPDDWVTFPGTETLNASFFPWDADNTISGNIVTVITTSGGGGRSLVRLYGDEFKYKNGYYLSVDLPDDSVKPQKIYALAINSPADDGDWSASDLAEAPDGSYLAGRVDLTWNNDDSTSVYTGIMLDIYWYAGQEDALYTFTVNKILVAQNVADTSKPWDDFVDFYSNSSPITTGAIAANWNDTYNQCLYNFTNADGKLFTGGYYLSVTLSEDNEVTPDRLMATAYDAGNAVQDGYVSQIISNVSGDTVTLFWNGNTWGGTASDTEHKTIELLFQWDLAVSDNSELDKTITFTVNELKVGALID
ncbi:MAG: InlB B-repeat-containing protein [Treponema sp.]|jgi:hypothetical protein|nr:InlB B-repeat-containing protein [Treponema sp.]